MIDRRVLLLIAIQDTLKKEQAMKMSHNDAEIDIAAFIERYNAGESIGIPAVREFGYWFQGRKDK